MNGLSPIARSSLAGYVLLTAVSAGLAAWQGRLDDILRFPGWGRTAENVLVGLLLAACVLAGGAALGGTFEWARRLEDEFRLLLGPLKVPDAVVLGASSGIAEEAFFRAVMQPAFGLWVTSLAFGLLHYPLNRRLIPWTGLAILMGFVFGVVYQSTGSLVAVALAHATINFFELLDIARKGEPRPAPLDPPVS